MTFETFLGERAFNVFNFNPTETLQVITWGGPGFSPGPSPRPLISNQAQAGPEC